MRATLEYMYSSWPARQAIISARWTTGGGSGEIPGGFGRGRLGGVGRPGAFAQSSAARNHRRGRRLHSGERGGHSDRQGANGKGMRGIQGKLKWATLGSALPGTEWDGARKRPQHTGKENQNRTDNRRTDLEGICHEWRDQAGFTEHSDGEGGGTGYNTPGVPSG